MLSTDYLKECAASFGLQMMAAIPLGRSGPSHTHSEEISRVLADLKEDADRFDAWRELGFSGDLSYLNKRSGCELTDPRKILFQGGGDSMSPAFGDIGAGPISILMFCIYYSRAQQPSLSPGFGRVARYAWGRDYHKVLGKRVKSFARALEESCPGLKCRGFTDAIPIMERAFGRVAKLGFIGKNTLLIQPGEGSFSLLAGVAISAAVEPFSTQTKLSNCGSCSRCLSNCPTGALIKPYSLDARRCISYLTIEKRGYLTEEESSMVGEWVFGCDICQEVCPFNERALKHRAGYTQSIDMQPSTKLPNFSPSWREFEQDAGVGPLLNLGEILMLRNDEQFVHRFQGTPLMRAKREGLLRNAACVAANTHAVVIRDPLEEAALMDSSPVVREHASRALRNIIGGIFLDKVPLQKVKKEA